MKRWWTLEVAAKRKTYGKTRRLYQEGRINTFTISAERNFYYYIVHSAKSQNWAALLQGAYEVIEESKRCWTSLRYTKP